MLIWWLTFQLARLNALINRLNDSFGNQWLILIDHLPDKVPRRSLPYDSSTLSTRRTCLNSSCVNPSSSSCILPMRCVLPFPCRYTCDFLEQRGSCHVAQFCDFLCRSFGVFYNFSSESTEVDRFRGAGMQGSCFGANAPEWGRETCTIPRLVSCCSNAFSKRTSSVILSWFFLANAAIGVIKD